MPALLMIFLFWIVLITQGRSQSSGSFACPEVKLTVHMLKHTFKAGEDIQLITIVENKTNTTQQVWFDKPKLSTGGPAMTFVRLINKKTGQSVLEYPNKAVLASQIYSTTHIKKSSYQLKPGQIIKGQFSLFDLVVVKNNNYNVSSDIEHSREKG